MSTQKSQKLRRLLTDCTSKKHSAKREKAWRQLIEQYKRYVFAVAAQNLKLRQFDYHEIGPLSKDIVQDVFLQLCQHEGLALKRYKNMNDAQVFQAYLARITKRIVSRKKLPMEKLPLDTQKYDKNFADDTSGFVYIYDEEVFHLRKASGPQERNTERDILLFNLMIYEGHDPAMLKYHPICANINISSCDNVLNRIREKLRKNFERN